MNNCRAKEDVLAYLWHGYLPPRDSADWLPNVFNTDAEHGEYTPREAAECFDGLFDRLVPEGSFPHIVPISGGLDSRLILAGLRERSNNILAVTLGQPGQLDYEIGANVAKVAGVEHYRIRLDQLTLEWEDLVATAHNSPWTYMPDAHFMSVAYRVAAGDSQDSIVWSGFLGDPLTGGHHSHGSRSGCLRTAFSHRQRRTPKAWFGDILGPWGYPAVSKLWRNKASEEQFLDFCIRQRGCIAPIVLGKEWEGWQAYQKRCPSGIEVAAPFADADWAAYWLRAPSEVLREQKLYRQMADLLFPDLFRLPSKNTWGVRHNQKVRQQFIRYTRAFRNRLHSRFPWMPIRSGISDNYLDFQKAFREREDYIAAMQKAISVLKLREVLPWLDLDSTWREHFLGRQDNAEALQVLLGLAVNIEANG